MDSLVSTDWLAAHLVDPDLLIIDATSHLPAAGRDARAEFAAAHIPGGRFLDLASLKDTASPVPSALPTGEQVAQRLADLGYSPDDQVVIYDDSDVKTSSRAWFALRRVGIASAILDGGLGKWRDEGRELESGQSGSAAAETSRSMSVSDDLVRTKSDMLANIASGAEQVIDARDAGRFTGEAVDTVHDLPGGHIPGARNLFFRDLYAEEGTFRPPTELRAAFETAGIDLGKPIVTSCGSGVTASVLLFALHLIGVDDAALYDGSWSEWGADPATPKETGVAHGLPPGAASL
jgi:thiosulfate/3-mercaptopyruvate sulfurtransferase